MKIFLHLSDAAQIGHVCERFRKVHQPWRAGEESGEYRQIQFWTLGTKGSVLPLEKKASSKHSSAELQLGGASFPFISQGTQGYHSLCSAAQIPLLSFPSCQLCLLLRTTFNCLVPGQSLFQGRAASWVFLCSSSWSFQCCCLSRHLESWIPIFKACVPVQSCLSQKMPSWVMETLVFYWVQRGIAKISTSKLSCLFPLCF